MRSLLSQLTSQRGWKRNLILLLAGALMASALAPLFIFPPLICALSFSLLFLMLEMSSSRRRAFLDGWWFGFGYFLAGLYWIPISLTVDMAAFGWMIPFALLGIPSVLAIYVGIVTLLVAELPFKGWMKVLAFALLWAGMEYARAHLFTGFPWNMVGYVWSASDISLQSAWLVSVYGLNFLTVIFSLLPVLLLFPHNRADRFLAGLAFLAFCGLMFWGHQRLKEDESASQQTLQIRLVQASIPQRLKWEPEYAIAALQQYIELSRKEGFDKLNAVIWPESAIPFRVEEGAPLMQELARAAPPGGYLIAGAVMRAKVEGEYTNSVVVINDRGELVVSYDKHHLVPFGEYVPFRRILPIDRIVKGAPGDFTPGHGPETLEVKGLGAFSPMICYEGIFPEEAVDSKSSVAPQWLLNITNDAWFGNSSGPYQHLEMARMRAVEQNMPLLRVANTGITASIDGKGRVISRLGLNQSGSTDFRFGLSVP